MVTKKYKIAGKHVEHNDSTSQALFLGGGRTEKSDGKHDKFWAKTTFEFLHRYGKVTIEEIHKWPCDKRADMPTSLSKCTKMFCCCCWCCSNSFGLYPNTTKMNFELLWTYQVELRRLRTHLKSQENPFRPGLEIPNMSIFIGLYQKYFCFYPINMLRFGKIINNQGRR